MKSVILAAVASLSALASPAQAAVTYTLSLIPNTGFIPTSFVLTTPQYITNTTTFSASAFSSCSVGGATQMACSSVQFVPNGTADDANSYLVLNTASDSVLLQFVVANFFASNRSEAIFTKGFGQFTITGSADAAPVPEPATWGMMILGLGLVGGTMRYRRLRSVRFA